MASHEERLKRCLAGEVVDRVPVSLWRHFPVEDQSPALLALNQRFPLPQSAAYRAREKQLCSGQIRRGLKIVPIENINRILTDLAKVNVITV